MDINADRSTLEFLREHLGATDDFKLEKTEDRELVLFSRQVHPCPHPLLDPLAKPLIVGTLSGFATLVAENIDGLDLAKFVAICTPSEVKLSGVIKGYHRQRETPIIAAYAPIEARLDGWVDQEEFLVKLGACFAKLGDLEHMIDLCSHVEQSEVVKRHKTGLKFEVQTGKELTGPEWEPAENPFMLAPFRSFPEAGDQVLSSFYLDVRSDDDGVSFRLIPADGEAWVPVAAAQVRAKLVELLTAEIEARGGACPTVVC